VLELHTLVVFYVLVIVKTELYYCDFFSSSSDFLNLAKGGLRPWKL
jgi:hypothetical protein